MAETGAGGGPGVEIGAGRWSLKAVKEKERKKPGKQEKTEENKGIRGRGGK